jgi:nitric oxide reductase subunit B
MPSYRGHWIALLLVIGVSFAVLGAWGPRISKAAPPIPERVLGPKGEVVMDAGGIRRGQDVWQSIGGQEVGSIWGHGAYVAPDWTADWLHREAIFVLDHWARAEGAADYAALSGERQAALRERLTREVRKNTFDARTGTVRLSAERAAAFDTNAAHYAEVFGEGRDAYAIPAGALRDRAELRDLAAFF